MSTATDFFDVIYTTRTIRKFTEEPVPIELVHQVLAAAAQAPSGGNRQPWTFLLVSDPAIKKKVGEFYRDGYAEFQGVDVKYMWEQAEASPNFHLAVHFGEAPVIVVVCARHSVMSGDSTGGAISTPASVYPAVQNILLAARAVGLGGALTTNHRFHHEEIKKLLGIPDEQTIFTMVPLGFPAQRHGKKTRQAIAETTYEDHWGNPAKF